MCTGPAGGWRHSSGGQVEVIEESHTAVWDTVPQPFGIKPRRQVEEYASQLEQMRNEMFTTVTSTKGPHVAPTSGSRFYFIQCMMCLAQYRYQHGTRSRTNKNDMRNQCRTARSSIVVLETHTPCMGISSNHDALEICTAHTTGNNPTILRY